MTNSIEIYEKLKSTMPDAQASAVVQAIEMAVEGTDSDHSNALANKVDQTKFDAEMHQLEANLNHSMAVHAARIAESFASQVAKINESIATQAAKTAESFAFHAARTNEKIAESIAVHAAQTDAKIAECKADTIRWMFIFWIGQLAAMVSIVKLLK